VAPGPGVTLHHDLNFKAEGYIRLEQVLLPFDLVWLEIDGSVSVCATMPVRLGSIWV
jgi:hypothetical protein